jgi:hypothetical protein
MTCATSLYAVRKALTCRTRVDQACVVGLTCVPAFPPLLLLAGILLVWNVNGAFIIGIFFTMFASWAKFPQKMSDGGLVPDKVWQCNCKPGFKLLLQTCSKAMHILYHWIERSCARQDGLLRTVSTLLITVCRQTGSIV